MAQRVTPATKSAAVKPQPALQKGTVTVIDAPRRSRRDPVDIIWNLFCSIRFAVVLNVSLALAAMLGTIVPQMPLGIQNFEVELNQFLQAARGRYGDISGVLYWAGFYDLYNSLWFRMLVMVVVFSIIICTLNRWQPVMRLINEPTVRVNDAFLQGLTEKAQFRSVPLNETQAHDALRDSLKRSRYRLVVEKAPDGSALHLYADRDRWSKLVTFVSHTALVILILVAAGLAGFGWREQSVYFYPGEPVNVGHGTDFSVRNDGFSIDYYPDGVAVKEYRNKLAVIENGKEVLTKTIIVNDPLQYKGVNFFLVSYQPVLYATAVDSSGQAAGLQRMGASGPITDTTPSGEAIVDFSFTGPDNLPMDLLQLPVPVGTRTVTVTLEMTYYQDVARGEGENPPVYVRAFVDKEFEKPVYDAFLPRTGPFRVPGFEEYSFAFRKDTTTILEVAKDPGLLYVGIFFGIMTLGFTLSLYTTFTRCWAKIAPSEDKPGTVNITLGGLAEKNKVTFERDFERLATRVRDALAKAASK